MSPRLIKTAAAAALTALGLLAAAPPLLAEDFPGGPPGSAADEFEKGFAAEKGVTDADRETSERDRLSLGGSLWSEILYYPLGTGAPRSSYFFAPSSLWLYLDGRLKKDVRGFVRFKTTYDPTQSLAGTNPFTGLATNEIVTDLEELKVFFNVSQSVFFTVGKQKTKWGSGKFWNPTDFLNSQRRNALYSTDLRSGLALLKTHLPVGASNFYLVQQLDGADRPERIRHAVRAEVPVFGTAEIAASAAFGGLRKAIAGLDVSTAIGDFDFHGELARSFGNDTTFFAASGSFVDPDRGLTSAVAGLSYEIPYGDNDSVTLSGEWFHQDGGYASTADYASVLAGGGYQPFNLGRDYAMLMVYVPKPGRLEHASFMLVNLMNVTDRTVLSRAEVQLTPIDDLLVALAVGLHSGDQNGEFKLGGQNVDFHGRLSIDF